MRSAYAYDMGLADRPVKSNRMRFDDIDSIRFINKFMYLCIIYLNAFFANWMAMCKECRFVWLLPNEILPGISYAIPFTGTVNAKLSKSTIFVCVMVHQTADEIIVVLGFRSTILPYTMHLRLFTHIHIVNLRFRIIMQHDFMLSRYNICICCRSFFFI